MQHAVFVVSVYLAVNAGFISVSASPFSVVVQNTQVAQRKRSVVGAVALYRTGFAGLAFVHNLREGTHFGFPYQLLLLLLAQIAQYHLRQPVVPLPHLRALPHLIQGVLLVKMLVYLVKRFVNAMVIGLFHYTIRNIYFTFRAVLPPQQPKSVWYGIFIPRPSDNVAHIHFQLKQEFLSVQMRYGVS